MTTEPPTYVVRFQPEDGADPIKALRRILKTSLRQFGMKCIDIREEAREETDRRRLVLTLAPSAVE